MGTAQAPTSPKPVVLVLLGRYLPGHKAGGPIYSIANLVDALGDEFRFCIVALGQDLGEKASYERVKLDAWNRVGKAEVFYLQRSSLYKMLLLIKNTNWNLLYANSFFSFSYSIWPLILWRLFFHHRGAFLLAPRGELSPGALESGFLKKRLFIQAARFLGHKLISYHLSTAREASELAAALNWAASSGHRRAYVARDLTSREPFVLNRPENRRKKIPGELDAVFISRIARKKNLDLALKILAQVSGSVRFNIFGSIEDPQYWDECARQMRTTKHSVHYGGSLRHEEAIGEFHKHHLFLFPTRGENYGHVIVEALCSGCPVVVSDQTPWRNLRLCEAGWDIPLTDFDSFVRVVQEFVDADERRFQELSGRARAYGMGVISDRSIVEKNREMLLHCLASHRE